MDETNTINEELPAQNPEERAHRIIVKQIAIEGMTCDQCVRTVEKALRSRPGVKSVEVEKDTAVATVTFDASQTDIPDLHDALLKAGYHPTRRTPDDQ